VEEEAKEEAEVVGVEESVAQESDQD